MSWLDFFKDRIKKKGLGDINRITIEGLQHRLKEESKNIKESFQDIRNRLRHRILQLDSELEIMVEGLKRINLEEKRENERLKFIVRQNLDAYISDIDNLMDDLRILDSKDEGYLGKVQIVFSNFIKSSVSSLEKARILIGKELVAIKSAINLFAGDVASMITENSRILARQKALNKLESLLSDLDWKKSAECELEDSMSKLEQNLRELEKRRAAQLKSLDDARNSDGYRRALEEKEKTKHKVWELQQEIAKFKHDIDLRYLSKQFHNDAKKNKIIRDYTENFQESLEKDDTLRLGDIIREVKPDFDIQKLKEIKLKNSELKSWQQIPIEKQIEDTEADIKRIDLEILDGKNEMKQEKKKKERLIERNSQILEDIKKEALLLWKNVEVY